jgi:hypothetical protein
MPAGIKEPVFIERRDGTVASSAPMGWLEGHIIQFVNSDHVYFDPSGRSFYLFLRANTAGTGYACVLRVIEQPDGQLFTKLCRTPGGTPMVFTPWPGGHNKFYLLYDTPSQRFWMASTQPSDSYKSIHALSDRVYGLPNNERHRLALYSSPNAFDWIFAGVISIGPDVHHSRNYPSMIVDEDDLLVVSRAGNDFARDSQYSNQILMHRIKQFRRLAY